MGRWLLPLSREDSRKGGGSCRSRAPPAFSAAVVLSGLGRITLTATGAQREWESAPFSARPLAQLLWEARVFRNGVHFHRPGEKGSGRSMSSGLWRSGPAVALISRQGPSSPQLLIALPVLRVWAWLKISTSCLPPEPGNKRTVVVSVPCGVGRETWMN